MRELERERELLSTPGTEFGCKTCQKCGGRVTYCEERQMPSLPLCSDCWRVERGRQPRKSNGFRVEGGAD